MNAKQRKARQRLINHAARITAEREEKREREAVLRALNPPTSTAPIVATLHRYYPQGRTPRGRLSAATGMDPPEH